MNSNNRHAPYRKNIYRKKKTKTLVAIITGTILVLALIFLVVGNLLDDELDAKKEESSSSADVLESDEHKTPKKIRSEFISLESEGYFSSKLNSANQSGAEAFGVGLTDKNGALLYRSGVAQKLGYQDSSSPSLKLSDMMSYLNNHDKPNSAIFRFDTLSDTDDLSVAANLGYDAALVAEASRAGFDEVLVVFPHMSEEHIDELVSFAEQIRSLDKEGTFGIAIPFALLEASENDAALARSLWDAFDFIAIDMTLVKEDTELINNENQIFLYQYSARLMIASSRKSELPDISQYINNWQIVD